MQITDIRVRRVFDNDESLKAIVSITLDEVLAVHDIKVIQGNSRTFVAFPSKKDDKGVYRDTVHPIFGEVRDRFEREILNAYDAHLALRKITAVALS